jgi:polysaccharide pyruvyl transferase WcaK-like protein
VHLLSYCPSWKDLNKIGIQNFPNTKDSALLLKKSSNKQTNSIVHRHKKFQAASYHYHYHIHRKSNRFTLSLPPFPCVTSFALSPSKAQSAQQHCLQERLTATSNQSTSTEIFALSSTPTTKSSSKYFIV